MEIVGYDNKDKFTHHLKEATLTCQELDPGTVISGFVYE